MKILISLLVIVVMAGAGLYFSVSQESYQSQDSDMLQLANFAYQEKRFEDAFKWYQNAAQQHIAEAQYQLANMYQAGEGVEKDDTMAINWLRKAAAQGLANAEYDYAMALEFGRGIPKARPDTFIPWYLKAAEHRHPKAMFKMAQLYFSGAGIKQDIDQALTWAIAAGNHKVPGADTLLQDIVRDIADRANQGDAKAQHMLALMHQQGRAVEKDNQLALAWLRKAASKGDVDAQYDLGRTLASTQSPDALYWLKKASRQGHIQAGYMTAALLAKQTNNKPEDIHQAWRWLYHGKQMQQPKVLYNLAIILQQGKLALPATSFHYQAWLKQAAQGNVTVAQNDYAVELILQQKHIKQAVSWLHKAAKSDAMAQFNLGLMYARGEGITPNDDEAVHWWKKAEKNNSAKAKMLLGLFYNLGRGVGRSEKEAVYWYQQAAKLGNQDAVYNLGVLYYNGIGIDRDYSKAAQYFETLAKQGDSEAQNIYASLFLEGQGVSYAPKTAVQWFQRAATAGNVRAMFNLATQYRTGNGIRQNDKKALFWYQKAAKRGFAPAQNALGYMYALGRGTKADKDKAEFWFQSAQDNGLKLARQNISALNKQGTFALLRLQIDNHIRSGVITDKHIDLARWLEAHHQTIL